MLEVMVIPTDCPIHRDSGMVDFHLYIALLCLQQVENANLLLMFLHLFLNRSGHLSFVLCYLYCNKRVYSILFSVICKHEILIFMFVGIDL